MTIAREAIVCAVPDEPNPAIAQTVMERVSPTYAGRPERHKTGELNNELEPRVGGLGRRASEPMNRRVASVMSLPRSGPCGNGVTQGCS